MDDLKKRFNQKWVLNKETGCWDWTASCAGQGNYGQIKIPGTRKQDYAHRVSYRINIGEIPEGKYVLHRCDNPKCVNPNHLFLGSAKDNAQDMKSKNRHLPGEKNSMSVLTTKDVVAIRAMVDAGISQDSIANRFCDSQMTISRIKRRLLWSHVP